METNGFKYMLLFHLIFQNDFNDGRAKTRVSQGGFPSNKHFTRPPPVSFSQRERRPVGRSRGAQQNVKLDLVTSILISKGGCGNKEC